MSWICPGCGDIIAEGSPHTCVPVAVWSGTVRLFGVEVQCHRLDDGRNIIEEDSMRRLLAAMASGALDVGDIESFAKLRQGEDPRGFAQPNGDV